MSTDEMHIPDRRDSSRMWDLARWFVKYQPVIYGLCLVGTTTGAVIANKVIDPLGRLQTIEENDRILFKTVDTLQVLLDRKERRDDARDTYLCLHPSSDPSLLAASGVPCAALLRDVETPEAERRRRQFLRAPIQQRPSP